MDVTRDLTEKDILENPTFQLGIKASFVDFIDGYTVLVIESPTKPATPKFVKSIYTGGILEDLQTLVIEDIVLDLTTYSDDIVITLEGGKQS